MTATTDRPTTDATTTDDPTTDAAEHAARYLANSPLLGAPEFQVAVWLRANPDDLSARSTGYLAATLCDRNVRDAVLIAACGAEADLVDAIVKGADPGGDGVRAVLAHPSVSETTHRVAALVEAVAQRVATTPVLAAEALALSAALAWLSGDRQRAALHAGAALAQHPHHRLAGLVLHAAALLPAPTH